MCILFAGAGGAAAFASPLTSSAALPAFCVVPGRLRAINTFEGGSALRSAAAATKTTTTTAAATATRAAASASAESGEAREQFSVGQLAVLVFVQLLECGGSGLDFLGGNFAVTVRIESGHDWEHPHEPARATGTTRRAAESTAGTTRTAGGASRKSASSAAATEPAGLRSA